MLDARDPDTRRPTTPRLRARIHPPERVEAHRHRRRRPARQLPARHRAVRRRCSCTASTEPSHAPARRCRRPAPACAGRPARRRRGRRGQWRAGALAGPTCAGRSMRAAIDKREARPRTCAAPAAASYRAVIPAGRDGRAGRRRRRPGRARPGRCGARRPAGRRGAAGRRRRARRPAQGDLVRGGRRQAGAPTASTFIAGRARRAGAHAAARRCSAPGAALHARR